MDDDLDRKLTNISCGLNWGLGLFGSDLVATLFGRDSRLARVVYTAVGTATAYTVVQALRR